MARTPSLIAPLRQPVSELADYYNVSVEALMALLKRLRLTPRQDSLSMAQDKKLAAYLQQYTTRT